MYGRVCDEMILLINQICPDLFTNDCREFIIVVTMTETSHAYWLNNNGTR
jgi:hypothetical protein